MTQVIDDGVIARFRIRGSGVWMYKLTANGNTNRSQVKLYSSLQYARAAASYLVRDPHFEVEFINARLEIDD